MPVTSQPTDQPLGQVITDEQALERIFRANYATLLKVAREKLGDAASGAPRVVSKAFHQAWNERARFRTAAELDSFLHEAIQHGSAREQSRRAALHRFEAHEGGPKEIRDVAVMTVDEAWERLQHTLHGGAPQALKERAAASRHEAAEHLAQLGKQKNWKPTIMIGAATVVAAFAVVWYLDRAGEGEKVARSLADSDARAHQTSYGQLANVTLDDGTVVRLGPETKLTVPRLFGPNMRAVKVDGTANFEVPASWSRPFEVRAGNAAIEVTGTNFTVRRYPDDSNTVVHVREGSVSVQVGQQKREVTMSILVQRDGSMRVPSVEELDEATTWTDGTLAIVGNQLREVLPKLRRWYGLDIKVQNMMLLDRPVFVRAPLNSPREAITSVEKSGGVRFTYIGENMAFEDTLPRRGRR